MFLPRSAEYHKLRNSQFAVSVHGGVRMRLFAEPLSAKLVWDEGELVALIVAGHRHTVVEQPRRWRVEADWWKEAVSRDGGLVAAARPRLARMG